MAFPTNPSPGDSYTDGYGTIWVYAGSTNGWYRKTVNPNNETNYASTEVYSNVVPTFTVGTRTTERTITAGSFDLSTGNLWTVGAITVPNPTNAVATQTGAIRITAGPTAWGANFKFPGGSAPTIATFPAIIPFYVQDSSTILMGNVTEGIT